jgi:hypothetical protein
MLEGSIDTIPKALEFIPAPPQPIFEYKPTMLDLVQVWRIRGQIPEFTSCFCHNSINRLGVVTTSMINHDDISGLQLRQ